MLRTAFEALERSGISFCLLHGEANLRHPVRDVDLLVARSDLGRVATSLAAVGFVAISPIGSGGHQVAAEFGAYLGTWVVLDIVCEMSYGPSGSFLVNWLRPRFATAAADACLERRVARNPYHVLHPDDAFWELLLNCIVDKGSVPERHGDQLVRLASAARTDGPLGSVVERWCPQGWSAEAIIDAVRARRWEDLLRLGPMLAASQTAANPVHARTSAFARGLRRLRVDLGRLVAARGGGLSVALLGPDGSGKSSLAARVCGTSPVPCHVVYMGLWQGQEGMGLPRQVLRASLRIFTVWRRYLVARLFMAAGGIVLFDRYVYDALLTPAPPLVRLKRAYFSILSRSCPAPDLVLLLDAPGAVMAARKPEAVPKELEAMRHDFLRVVEQVHAAQVIDAGKDEDSVFTDAASLIWDAYRAKTDRTQAAPSRDMSPNH